MPMTLLERAVLTESADFRKRLESAQMIVAAEVLAEDPATASHAQRLKLAAYVLREPELVARRLSYVMRAMPTLAEDIADADILDLVRARWTAFANALVS